MVRHAYPPTARAGAARIAITSQAQAQYLFRAFRALMATEGLFGRARDAEVDHWLRAARVTLLDVIPADQARALLRETEALLQGIDVSR